MKISELETKLGLSRDALLRAINRNYPELVKHGVETEIEGHELEVLLRELRGNKSVLSHIENADEIYQKIDTLLNQVITDKNELSQINCDSGSNCRRSTATVEKSQAWQDFETSPFTDKNELPHHRCDSGSNSRTIGATVEKSQAWQDLEGQPLSKDEKDSKVSRSEIMQLKEVLAKEKEELKEMRQDLALTKLRKQVATLQRQLQDKNEMIDRLGKMLDDERMLRFQLQVDNSHLEKKVELGKKFELKKKAAANTEMKQCIKSIEFKSGEPEEDEFEIF